MWSFRHADGEFGFYAHLIKGTIPVRIGDKVRAGDEIGRCGHTGHSSEPHLHFHLQDTPSIFTGMGFTDSLSRGGRDCSRPARRW